jgi:hypothetical protein
MVQFKELTIGRTPNGFLPRLPLNGKWLENLGFTVGKSVSATFENSCLTLTISTSHSDLLVETRIVRHRPRTTLTLNAFYLKKYGFRIGDRVGLHLAPNQIQISKIIRYTTDKVA